MSDFLTRRGGTWHFVCRVPSALGALDLRGSIRHSTRIRVAEDRVDRRAARVVQKLKDKLERYSHGLAGNQASAELHRYDEARRRARARLRVPR